MTDEHLSVWARLRRWLGNNRIERMRQHYRAVCDELTTTSTKDKEETLFFKRKFEQYYRKAQRMYIIYFFSGVFLYATVLISLLKLIPLLSFLVTFIELGSSMFSSLLLVALFFWSRLRINLYLDLMSQSMMHLVALYQRNPKRDAKKALRRISEMM